MQITSNQAKEKAVACIECLGKHIIAVPQLKEILRCLIAVSFPADIAVRIFFSLKNMGAALLSVINSLGGIDVLLPAFYHIDNPKFDAIECNLCPSILELMNMLLQNAEEETIQSAFLMV